MKKNSFDSLFITESNELYDYYYPFNKDSKFYFIQTKSETIFLSFITDDNKLYICDVEDNEFYFIDEINSLSFQKFISIKDEIAFLIYYSGEMNYNFKIYDCIIYDGIYLIFESNIKIDEYVGFYYVDIIFLSEVKAAFVVEEYDIIYIYILNFFNDYRNYMINKISLNIHINALKENINSNSLVFQYKNLLGLNIENLREENGFILFGYYNSTDPKHILNIKKDGLNYNIIIGEYLNLQSNIFEYKFNCVRIFEVPNNESGLYFISNTTKESIKKDDCIDLNTKISLYFSYNGTLKKGNYLFKFAAILQEQEYEIIKNYSDDIYWNEDNNTLKDDFIKEYNERRNMNITGKSALVPIYIFDDIKVFCDKKYDEFALKQDNRFIDCGEGVFYDVENVNEITQLNLGINYYFDNIKNSYIKCHEKCKTCSREFNNTNMNCDECIDNYFIRDDNCLEISKCEYNYYYDTDLNLNCINRNIYCPDFKPYENKFTKECIENCSLSEFNRVCNPTNNKVSIKDTYRRLLENIEILFIKERLLLNKEKYSISGNNILFIFSTSEIEEKELIDNYNHSSIILGEVEILLKKLYSIPDQLPIPILKIEILNNYSNIIELKYELFNPLDLYRKLNLSLISENYIEIRLPNTLKQYKLDLISKTKNLGYNIFDLNDSFYNDICSIFTYNNCDITLSERKKLLDLSDENLCLINCNYSNFDINTIRPICLCDIGLETFSNISQSLVKNINQKNNDLLNLVKTNIDISKSSNIKVVKCFKIIFRMNLFTENYGFYIMLFMNLFNIILLIFSPISKVNKQFNNYCNKIINQM